MMVSPKIQNAPLRSSAEFTKRQNVNLAPLFLGRVGQELTYCKKVWPLSLFSASQSPALGGCNYMKYESGASFETTFGLSSAWVFVFSN